MYSVGSCSQEPTEYIDDTFELSEEPNFAGFESIVVDEETGPMKTTDPVIKSLDEETKMSQEPIEIFNHISDPTDKSILIKIKSAANDENPKSFDGKPINNIKEIVEYLDNYDSNEEEADVDIKYFVDNIV